MNSKDLKLCNEECMGKWPCLFHENHFLPNECPHKEVQREIYCKPLKYEVGHEYQDHTSIFRIIEIVPQGETGYYRVKLLNPDKHSLKWADDVGHDFIYNTTVSCIDRAEPIKLNNELVKE